MIHRFFAIILLHAAGILPSCSNIETRKQASDSVRSNPDSTLLAEFSHGDLRTNWEKHSVPLDSIFDGGVGKNDIPAIDFPEFVTVTQARSFLSEPDFGIFIDLNGAQKFYPYNILNWHEVVNDNIGGKPLAVTFCPLCGSAIVYERVIQSDTLLFGVSGKLYESNLLMFDNKNESLWSQAMGEAVAGDYTGQKLVLVNSAVISFEEVADNFPETKVLSTQTGFERNYNVYPYSDYNASDDLYFPVSKRDPRFKNKDMMYVVETGNSSVAFPWRELLAAKKATQPSKDGTIEVTVTDFFPSSVKKETGEKLNGYFSYWFSWYSVKGEKGIVWKPRN